MTKKELQEIIDLAYSIQVPEVKDINREELIAALIQENAIRTAGKWISESLDYIARGT